MSDPNDTQPAPAPAAEGAAQTPAPAPTEAPAPQPSPHADNEVRMTQAQLDERLERGFKAMLSKQFGTNDPSQLQAMINEANDLKTKAEEQRKAEMSAIERAQAEKARGGGGGRRAGASKWRQQSSQLREAMKAQRA